MKVKNKQLLVTFNMKLKIFPKNKKIFEKLIPFAQNIISICEKNNIPTIIYGSFAHFYHTKDEKMTVNDLDILIQKKEFPKAIKVLGENEINFKYYPKFGTIIIEKDKLKVELDKVWSGYKNLKDESMIKTSTKIDFYGIQTKIITLKQLKEIYPKAYKISKDNKTKILEKIKHLEKFLGEKLI